MTTIREVVREAAVKGKEATEAYKASLVAADSAADTTSSEETPAADLAKLSFKAVQVDEQGVITLCASSIAKDGEGDVIEKGAMIGMAYDFCAGAERVFRANHDESAPIEAKLVESCVGVPVLKSGKVLEPGEAIPEDDPFDHVRTMDAAKACNTHWFVSVMPTDPEIVKAAKEGKIVGSSWGGMALKAE